MGMIIQNGKQYFPVSNIPRFWLLNKDVNTEVLNNIGSRDQKTRSWAPFVSKVRNNSSSGDPVMYSTSTVGGISKVPCVYRNGYETGGVILTTKIPGGFYKKLYVDCEVSAYISSAYRLAMIVLTPTPNFQNNGQVTSEIKRIYLAFQNMTSEEINAQEGVTINSTSNVSLPLQRVGIDVSDILSDFYFSWFNCDLNVAIVNSFLE